MREYDVVTVQYKGDGTPFSRPETQCYSIVIDNTGNDMPAALEAISVIPMRENIGWVRGANVGLSIATAPFVVLLNDDIEVMTDNWLQLLSEPMRQDPKIAAVGPRTNRPCPQGRLGGMANWSHVECRPGLGGDCIGDYPLSFFCVMFRREALEDVGLFDMKLSPAYGDDDDWLLRAHLKGWRFAVQPKVFVKHEGSQSSTLEEKAEWQTRNKAYLKEKWTGRI